MHAQHHANTPTHVCTHMHVHMHAQHMNYCRILTHAHMHAQHHVQMYAHTHMHTHVFAVHVCVIGTDMRDMRLHMVGYVGQT